jgi:hypothetical protein
MMDPETAKMFDQMKAYFDEQIEKSEHHLEAVVNIKFQALEKSTDLSRNALEIRLENMNEFRGTLTDQAKTLYSRQEHDLYAEKVNDQIKSHQSTIDQLKGKADQSAVLLAILFSSVGILLSIIDFIRGLV